MRAAVLVVVPVVLIVLGCDNTRWQAPECPEPIELEHTFWQHAETQDVLEFVDGRVILHRADQTSSARLAVQPAPDSFTATDCRGIGPLERPRSDRLFVSFTETNDGFELRLRAIGTARFRTELAAQGSFQYRDESTGELGNWNLASSIRFEDDGRQLVAQLEKPPERFWGASISWGLEWEITTSIGNHMREGADIDLHMDNQGDGFFYAAFPSFDCI